MERLNAILNNRIFCEELRRLKKLECDRVYCCHGIEHLLDVARTAWILCLERNAQHRKDVVYAVALLHDIGRAVQYESGIPHEQAGPVLAEKILQQTQFTRQEQDAILQCIKAHRIGAEGGTTLSELISEADKRSRPCFACAVADSCKWPDERKNLSLTI